MMFNQGKISKAQQTEALNAPLPSSNSKKYVDGYTHFVFDELTALSEKYGFKVGGKLEIFTFLDLRLQEEIEQIAKTYSASDKAIFILDKDSCGFKACISTVGNIARLPGSLIKPLLVYAPAIEEEYISPATPILDEKINYSGYCPENYNGVYHGYVSARESLEKSLNVPAVKILSSLTLNKAIPYLEDMQLPVQEEEKSLALALGGMKNGYPLKDILAAYRTLQNDGIYQECGFISSIQIDGKTIYIKPNTTKRVFSPETASLITDMLKSTVKNGTAKKLRGLAFEIAAKTGTVGTNEGNTDAYALSYTTKDCAGIWLGNADNTKIPHNGSGEPCRLLREINEQLYNIYQERKENIPIFQLDKNIKSVELDKQSYCEEHALVLADENAPVEYRISELFKSTAIPLKRCQSFSSPSIPAPSIQFKDGVVRITFENSHPKYYVYKIERYDGMKSVTLYFGAYTPQFCDDSLLDDKSYVYAITPIFNGVEGTTLRLPNISTKKGEKAEFNQEILSKDWWNN